MAYNDGHVNQEHHLFFSELFCFLKCNQCLPASERC